MVNPDAPAMSANISSADWIRERLSPWNSNLVSAIIPSGFEAYVRILHPVQDPRDAVSLIRWADVSRWSGVPLHPRVQWHDVALPETIPLSEPPWRSQGPRQGTLFISDAEALIDDLTHFTSSTEDCFFCLWIGYFGGGAAFVPLGSPPVLIPAPPQPPALVVFPTREYGLFEGSLSQATSLGRGSGHDLQTPNLWWSTDHSWCVASEIDLPWTYVGGSSELIARLLADERLETVSASPDDSPWIDIAGWLSDLIEKAVDEVLSSGSVNLTLATGNVTVQWQSSRWRRKGMVTTRSERPRGWGGSESPVRTRNPDEIRRQITFAIQRAVLSLVQV